MGELWKVCALDAGCHCEGFVPTFWHGCHLLGGVVVWRVRHRWVVRFLMPRRRALLSCKVQFPNQIVMESVTILSTVHPKTLLGRLKGIQIFFLSSFRKYSLCWTMLIICCWSVSVKSLVMWVPRTLNISILPFLCGGGGGWSMSRCAVGHEFANHCCWWYP